MEEKLNPLNHRYLYYCETAKGEAEKERKFRGSYTPCNIVFMTVGDANINTCASSVTQHRAEWVSIKGGKRSECSSFYSTLKGQFTQK